MSNADKAYTTDREGRPYARLSELKPGMIVRVDDSFFSGRHVFEIEPWGTREVRLGPEPDENGEPWLFIDAVYGGQPVEYALEFRAFGLEVDDDDDTLFGIYYPAEIELRDAEKFVRDWQGK